MKKVNALLMVVFITGCGDSGKPDNNQSGTLPSTPVGSLGSPKVSLRFTTEIMRLVADTPHSTPPGSDDTKAPSDFPVFTVSSSEYPSWAALGVAGRRGMINPERGKVGPIERKYKVDVVLMFKDYDTCISGYGSGAYDATCVTNIDILAPSLGRPTVAFCPTSTSDGGDACLGAGWKDPSNPDDKGRAIAAYLKGKKVRGLEKSVSECVFYMGLEKYGLNPDDFKFTNMDPAQAAQGMQQGQFDTIMVWNPFIRQTMKTSNAGVIFTSHVIPGVVIDMMVMGADSYAKPGGRPFCAAITDAYYSVCRLLEDEKHRDDVLVDLGKNFSSLDAKEMALCLQDTHFYATPDEGVKVYNDPKLRDTMDKVTGFCKRRGLLQAGQDPTITYDK